MIRLYNNIKEKTFEKEKEKHTYSKTIFGLAWFHSILVERKKFKTLGWNVMYDFNDSDFSACARHLGVPFSKVTRAVTVIAKMSEYNVSTASGRDLVRVAGRAITAPHQSREYRRSADPAD